MMSMSWPPGSSPATPAASCAKSACGGVDNGRILGVPNYLWSARLIHPCARGPYDPLPVSGRFREDGRRCHRVRRRDGGRHRGRVRGRVGLWRVPVCASRPAQRHPPVLRDRVRLFDRPAVTDAEACPSRAQAVAMAGSGPRLSSRELFRGQREIVILHAGHEYRLRITRADKLILTK